MPPLHLYLTTLPRDFMTPPATLHGLARIPVRNPTTPSQTFRHINMARGPSPLLAAARLAAHLVALSGIPFSCTSSNFSGSLSHSSTSSAQVLLKSMCSISFVFYFPFINLAYQFVLCFYGGFTQNFMWCHYYDCCYIYFQSFLYVYCCLENRLICSPNLIVLSLLRGIFLLVQNSSDVEAKFIRLVPSYILPSYKIIE